MLLYRGRIGGQVDFNVTVAMVIVLVLDARTYVL